MSKTLAQIRTVVTNQIDQGTTDSDSHFTETELNEYINMAYTTLCREITAANSGYFEKQANLTVSSGDVTKVLPSDFAGKVISLVNTSESPSVPLTHKIRRKEFLLSPTSGKPRYFDFLGNGYLWLYPTHDAADITLQITYEYLPAELDDDTDLFEFPVGYERLIAWDVILSCMLKDSVTARELLPRHMNLKNKMLNDISRPKQKFTAGRVRRV